jgi:uncharacterized protein YbjT (DUF2867 family)
MGFDGPSGEMVARGVSLIMPAPRTALLAGASGLVGGHCLRLLLAEPAYGRVIALGRRALPLQHAKLEQKLVDFAHIADLAPRADDVYCCLGTTIKKAGSQATFRKVDHDYVVALAQAAKQSGARRFLLVSAIGANPRSQVFYSRVKGETERDVSAVAFAAVHIFRPSMLLGDRAESRLGERLSLPVFRMLTPLLAGPLRPYRAIAAETVARAMIRAALGDTTGVRVHRYDEMTAG